MSKVSKEKYFCLQCGKILDSGSKFCSRECKSKSQTKRINLTCVGCGKLFSIYPYLKRKTNYCSVECYLNSTRRKRSTKCLVCGKDFLVKEYLVKQGYGLYCSRKCQFADYPDKINKICPRCDKGFKVQPSIEHFRKFCSEKCRDNSVRDYVTSICKKCGKIFELPRSDLNRGRGNFCTYRCYLTYRGPSTLEEKMEKALNLAEIKFEREIKFKRFHVDFLLRDLKIVVECDGEHWHLSPKIQERDKRKDKLLGSLGYKVLRFSGKVMDKLSEKQIADIIANLICN